MSGKKQDPDVLALKRAARALDKCTSRDTVKATLDYLYERYLVHPSKHIPEHLKTPKTGGAKE